MIMMMLSPTHSGIRLSGPSTVDSEVPVITMMSHCIRDTIMHVQRFNREDRGEKQPSIGRWREALRPGDDRGAGSARRGGREGWLRMVGSPPAGTAPRRGLLRFLPLRLVPGSRRAASSPSPTISHYYITLRMHP